ncbi:MAG: HutD family protein [Burkholderiaceae bacterium]|nr:HutD family protein [Burkholderiaceae bacterium]
MQAIAYQDLIATPWKNGAGVTRELVCYPAGATLDDFLWRVSIAEVGQSGPFSRYDGVDRVIALLDGDGMRLQFAQGRHHDLSEKLAPFAFRGEDSVHARLIGTSSRDFNLMLRRGAAQGTLEVHRASSTIARNQSTLLLFCATGSWQVSSDGVQNMRQGDTILIEESVHDTIITALATDSALLCARITVAQVGR